MILTCLHSTQLNSLRQQQCHSHHALISVWKDPTHHSSVTLHDLRPCCRIPFDPSSLMGEWYYPNKTRVDGNGATEGKNDIFRTRGDRDGTVSLFRRNNDIISPFGSYCCEIPDSRLSAFVVLSHSNSYCCHSGHPSSHTKVKILFISNSIYT